MIKTFCIILLFLILSAEMLFTEKIDSLYVTSTSFFNGDQIPAEYSCEGEDISPALKWTNAPNNTKSFALIADDPDAPGQTWVHWVLYDIPASVTFLDENQGSSEIVFHGAKHGKNSFGNNNYGGPCPPTGHGQHRYFFKVYALDKMLELTPGKTKQELLEAMQGHILASDSIIGTYERK